MIEFKKIWMKLFKEFINVCKKWEVKMELEEAIKNIRSIRENIQMKVYQMS